MADNGDNSWIAEWNRPRFSDTFEDSKKSRWPRLPFIDKPL
ncbi:unnamed protein product [Acidithrix sp. C25]|nr:unnamed protein product [Acidithrix sp. C25]